VCLTMGRDGDRLEGAAEARQWLCACRSEEHVQVEAKLWLCACWSDKYVQVVARQWLCACRSGKRRTGRG